MGFPEDKLGIEERFKLAMEKTYKPDILARRGSFYWSFILNHD